MRHRLLLLWLAVISPLATAQAPWGDSMEAPVQPESVEDCRLIQKGVRRLACYDRFMPRNPADSSTRTTAEEETSGTGQRTDSLVTRLVRQQQALWSYSGSFLPYRPMYVLPLTWTDDPNQIPESESFGQTPIDEELDNEEVKFQISFKLPLLTGWLDNRTTLWFGYTQLSLWQAYNQDESALFRETNFEPELFVQYKADWKFGPGQFDIFALGFNHQSNGRSDPFSRSWNRVLAQVFYSADDWVVAIRPWYRIPDSGEDDNPDIHRYLGYAEYNLLWKVQPGHTLGLQLHNSLATENNRTSVSAMWTFPLSDSLDGYLEYFNGYGETLIDYNHRQQRIGIGVMVNNWL